MITNHLLVPPLWTSITLQQIRKEAIAGGFILRLSIRNNQRYLSMAKQLLSEAERLRANRFLKRDDQLRFVLGRSLLRKILSLYIHCSETEVPLVYNTYGKPTLADRSPVKMHFNISHSEDYVLIALSNSPIGIDTKHLATDFLYQDFVSTIFSSAEVKAIKQAPVPYETFYLLWTRKEAFLKNMGYGLALSPQAIPVLDGQHPLPTNTLNAYEIYSFSYAHDYIGSVCLEQTASTKIDFYSVDLG